MDKMQMGIKKDVLKKLISFLSQMEDPLEMSEEMKNAKEMPELMEGKKPEAEISMLKIEAEPKEEMEDDEDSMDEESYKKKLKHKMAFGV
jgi:hypothetical protein